MTSIEFLESIQEQDIEIDEQLLALSEKKARAISISAVVNSERVQTSMVGDRIGKELAEIAELENEINHKIDKLYATKRKAMDAIAKMGDENLQEVLLKRYFEYKNMPQIAREEKITVRGVQKRHSKAIKLFNEKRK